jgi:hypothetical protein
MLILKTHSHIHINTHTTTPRYLIDDFFLLLSWFLRPEWEIMKKKNIWTTYLCSKFFLLQSWNWLKTGLINLGFRFKEKFRPKSKPKPKFSDHYFIWNSYYPKCRIFFKMIHVLKIIYSLVSSIVNFYLIFMEFKFLYDHKLLCIFLLFSPQIWFELSSYPGNNCRANFWMRQIIVINIFYIKIDKLLFFENILCQYLTLFVYLFNFIDY